ncbi:condensation domain-containing protein, partial [Cohnella silvisoli]
AYVVADRECTSGELRRHCGERLPEYMIPASFTQLEAMPLTASGKTNRKALPAPEASMATGTAYAAPGNETEEKLVGIWQELLQREMVGIDDNFFELGGHSLKAATLSVRIEQAFSVRLSLKEIFVHPTIRSLADRLSSGNTERAYPPIQPAPRKDYYAVSSAQEQMLIHQRRNPASLSYNMPSLLLLIGIPDIAKLRDGLGKLMARHESLRTSFKQIDGRMVQRVNTDVAIPFHQIDKTEFFGNRPGNWEASASAWVRPFDLAEAPLFRVGLVSLDADRHLLLLDIHHAISDGVTTVLLIRDLIALYEGKTLPAVKAQLKDYSEWLSAYLSGEELERHRAYWLSRFAEGVPRLDLPYDTTRESISDPASLDESARYRWILSDELKVSLEQLANNAGSTLFMVLLASYQAMLSHWSGSSEVVTGVPSAGRSHPDLVDTAGLLLHTMAIRNRIDLSDTFDSWLSIVKESMLQALDHAWLSVEELVELLDERSFIRWESTRNPLFDTLFVMQNMDASPMAAGELGWQPLEWDSASAKMDLVLQAEEKNGKLQLSFEYRSRLFEADTVAQMAEGFQKLLVRVAAESHTSLRELTGLQDESGKGRSTELFETGFDF